MNLLENHIKEVYYVKDITKEYVKSIGTQPKEPLLEVGLRVDCYGNETSIKKTFFKSNWEKVQKDGFYMA